MASTDYHNSDERIKESFAQVKRHKAKGAQAPHRPLLLMLMLGHYWNNGNRLVLFREAAIPLWELLNKFAEPGVNYPPLRALYPFATMDTESRIWERSHPNISHLQYKAAFAGNMKGGFVDPLYRRIINDKPFLLELAILVHKLHVPKIDFGQLLEAVNIPNRDVSRIGHLERKPYLADEVPAGSHCSVCNYSGIINKHPVGLRQTHVKWPEAGGPETAPDNILIMCEQHKNLFDCGVFTLKHTSDGLDIKVSKSYKGTVVVKKVPQQDDWQESLWPKDRIKPGYVKWHNAVVYSSG